MKLVADTTEALGRRVKIIGWFRPKGQPMPQPINPIEVMCNILTGRSVSNILLVENAWIRWICVRLHRVSRRAEVVLTSQRIAPYCEFFSLYLRERALKSF